MENNNEIKCQELSALVRILIRAETSEERPHFIRWVDETYDWLEEWGDDTSIETFKSQLLCRCVELLDLMPASETFNCNFQEFMTAAELEQQKKRKTMLRTALDIHVLKKAPRAQWIWRQPPRPDLLLVYQEPYVY